MRNTPVNKKDSDRSDDYTIKRVSIDIDQPNFKIYMVPDHSKKIAASYKKHRSELKEKTKPAKVKVGLFSKKQDQSYSTNKTKKKSLFSKK